MQFCWQGLTVIILSLLAPSALAIGLSTSTDWSNCHLTNSNYQVNEAGSYYPTTLTSGSSGLPICNDATLTVTGASLTSGATWTIQARLESAAPNGLNVALERPSGSISGSGTVSTHTIGSVGTAAQKFLTGNGDICQDPSDHRLFF